MTKTRFNMNVISFFNGMNCGRMALENVGIHINNYWSFEIDKHAIRSTQTTHPDTIQMGSVVDFDVTMFPKIDLFIGGSPCQSFSFAGKRKGMSTKDEIEILTLEHYLQLKNEGYEFEGQSYLFWEFMRTLTDLKKVNPDIKFLLENVIMGEKWERILTLAIGVNPIEINSALVSAQNRRRLYWTNIGMEPCGLFGDLESIIQQPKDKFILLKDVLENDVNDKYFLSEKMVSGMFSHTQRMKEKGNGFEFKPTEGNEKGKSLITKNGQRPDDNYIVAMRGRNPENPKSRKSGLNTEQQLEPRFDGKTNCLTSVQKDNLVQIGNIYESEHNSVAGRVYTDAGKSVTLSALGGGGGAKTGLYMVKSNIRRLTPRECGRLQTIPSNHLEKMISSGISDTQLYKMFGNGWTVDVIAHIFSYLNK